MTHTHQHTEPDWDAMGQRLEDEAEINGPAVRQALSWLAASAGPGGVTRAVDAGSGPGVIACMIAEEFPDARVYAIDSAAALLERTRTRVERTGLGARVETRHAELSEGLAELGPVDLIWAARVLHHVGDQQAAVGAVASALAPGGVLAAAEGGLPSRFLPRDIGFGRPGLLARIDALHEGRFAEMRASLPGATDTVEDWPAMFTRAGLVGVASRSFLLDRPAPVDARVRAYLRHGLERYAESAELDADDRDAVARLCDPEAAEGLMRRPDVFLLNAVTVHTGRAPEAAGR